MGYRSDVLIAVAFKTKEERDEVWAIYCMDPRVQANNLAAAWQNHDDEGVDAYCLWYVAECVKWYDGYADVSGIEHLYSVVQNFADNREMAYGYVKYRVGEETQDIEEESTGNDGSLQDYLWVRCGIRRELTHNFGSSFDEVAL